MAEVNKSVLVPYSAAQMYGLVDAVEQYIQFLPWCGGVELIERSDTITIATIHIDYHGIKQKFTTKNTKQFPHEMVISLQEGPFRQMEGFWKFIPLSDNACKIEFRLVYEFSNVFLDKLISPVFSHIANTFVDAFVARAEDVFESKGF